MKEVWLKLGFSGLLAGFAVLILAAAIHSIPIAWIGATGMGIGIVGIIGAIWTS